METTIVTHNLYTCTGFKKTYCSKYGHPKEKGIQEARDHGRLVYHPIEVLCHQGKNIKAESYAMSLIIIYFSY